MGSAALAAFLLFSAYLDVVFKARAKPDPSVYQVNLTRRLSAPLPPGADVAALGAALAEGNPAPYSAVVRLPMYVLDIDRDYFWKRGISGRAQKDAGR